MSIESIQSRIYEIETRFQAISPLNYKEEIEPNRDELTNLNDNSISLDNKKNKQSEKNNFSQLFTQYAKKYNIDPDLVKAVAQAESGFSADAVSSAGAKGIMQLMPQTAKELGVQDISDPEENIAGGTKYLSKMLNRYNGDVKLALAAYNAGPGNVEKFGGIPPFAETKSYVNAVQKYYQQIKQRGE